MLCFCVVSKIEFKKLFETTQKMELPKYFVYDGFIKIKIKYNIPFDYSFYQSNNISVDLLSYYDSLMKCNKNTNVDYLEKLQYIISYCCDVSQNIGEGTLNKKMKKALRHHTLFDFDEGTWDITNLCDKFQADHILLRQIFMFSHEYIKKNSVKIKIIDINEDTIIQLLHSFDNKHNC